ncbi:MAG: hypothetical protein RIB60_10105 [Phycisphaerales bacterium]
MSPHPIAPAWIVLPLSAVALVVIAGYLVALRAAPTTEVLPPSRRRIRMASGWVSMITVALLAYGFGVATPANARVFMLVWIAGTAMVGLVLMLAFIDLADSYRIRRDADRARRRELAAARRAALRGAGLHQRSAIAHARPAESEDTP